MADRLISLLVPRTVLIASGKSIGTGCFIAPGYILTCAHVVRDPLPAGESIKIYYNAGDPEKKESLKSVVVTAVILSDMTEGKEYPDVAVLKIAETVHPLLQLSPKETKIHYRADQEYLAVGFQKKEMETGRNIAQTVSLNYEGEEGAGYMNKLLFENGLVRPGMSGAPLVERQSGQIVGIVHMTRDAGSDLGAIVIPVDKIWEVLKEKATDVHDWLISKKGSDRIRSEYQKFYPRFPMIQQYGIRLLLLPLILFFLLFWVFCNIGQIQEAKVVAAMLVVIGFAGKLLTDWMGSDVAIETSNAKSKAGAILFRWPVIGFLGIVTLALWLCVTSVIIYNHDPKGTSIKLSRVMGSVDNRSRGIDPGGKEQFLVPIIPFKDIVYLEPAEREAVEVVMCSFERRELHYPESFKLEPVVLLMFDHNYFRSDSLGNYVVHLKSNDWKDSIVVDLKGKPGGSLIIGKRNMTFTETEEAFMKKELIEYQEPTKSKYIRKWKTLIPISKDLSVNSKIKITLIKNSGEHKVKSIELQIDDGNNQTVFTF